MGRHTEGVRGAVSDRHDSESTPDAGELPELDLTPRTVSTADQGSTNRSRRGGRSGRGTVIAIVCVVVIVAGFFAVKALGNATLYFYQADEALSKKHELADKRFRMLGIVDPTPVQRTADGVTFTVSFGTATVPVRHQGDPPQLFKAGVPVVLEGEWSADRSTFQSDRILVKHTEEYVEKNPERKTEADSPTP